jgi:hypothetical protein
MHAEASKRIRNKSAGLGCPTASSCVIFIDSYINRYSFFRKKVMVAQRSRVLAKRLRPK